MPNLPDSTALGQEQIDLTRRQPNPVDVSQIGNAAQQGSQASARATGMVGNDISSVSNDALQQQRQRTNELNAATAKASWLNQKMQLDDEVKNATDPSDLDQHPQQYQHALETAGLAIQDPNARKLFLTQNQPEVTAASLRVGNQIHSLNTDAAIAGQTEQLDSLHQNAGDFSRPAADKQAAIDAAKQMFMGRVGIGAATQTEAEQQFLQWRHNYSLSYFKSMPDAQRLAELSPVDMSQPRVKQAVDFFQSERGGGFSKLAATGIVGGLLVENPSLSPSLEVMDSDGLPSKGIAMFHLDRRDALNKVANPNDFQTQLDFIANELRTSEKGAADKLRSASTPIEATNAALAYERPQGYQGGFGTAAGGDRRLGNTISLFNGSNRPPTADGKTGSLADYLTADDKNQLIAQSQNNMFQREQAGKVQTRQDLTDISNARASTLVAPLDQHTSDDFSQRFGNQANLDPAVRTAYQEFQSVNNLAMQLRGLNPQQLAQRITDMKSALAQGASPQQVDLVQAGESVARPVLSAQHAQDEAALKDINETQTEVGQRGARLGSDRWARMQQQYGNSSSPAVQQAFQTLSGTQAILSHLEGGTPQDAENAAAALASRGADSKGQFQMIQAARKFADQQRTDLTTDPMDRAARDGVTGQLMPIQPGMNQDDLAAAMTQRAVYADVIGRHYGIEPKFFTTADRTALQQIASKGGQPMVDAAAAINKGFGTDAGQAFKEIGKDAPGFAHIGTLQLIGGDPVAIAQVAELNRLASDKDNRRSIEFPKKETLEQAAADRYGSAFAAMPDFGDGAVETAKKLVALNATQQHIPDPNALPPEKYLHLAAGGTYEGDRKFGGVDKFGNGYFSSQKVAIPPNVLNNGNAFTSIVGSITDNDLKELGAKTASGTPFPAASLKSAYLQSVGTPGRYLVSINDPTAAGEPKYVMGDDGRKFVLNLNTMEDILRARNPLAYKGAPPPPTPGGGWIGSEQDLADWARATGRAP